MRVFVEPIFTCYYKKYPLVLVDVGASGGFSPNWKAASKYLKVIGFEPDEREFTNLQKKNDKQVVYLNAALSNCSQEVPFYMNRKQQTSSAFEPNRPFIDQFPESERFEVMRKTKIRVDSLDNQLAMHHIEGVDFIKVDTDGSELFVLQGASRVMDQHVFGVEVEVEYAPLHLGQPQFSDLDKFMQSKGFQLFDLKNHYWKRTKGQLLGKSRGQIIFGDALYFKTVDALAAMVDAIVDLEARKVKVIRILSICALYGYFDYAKQIFDHYGILFSAPEKALVERWFNESRGRYTYIPDFKGRRLLARGLYLLSDIFRCNHHGWAAVERDLGNK